MARPKMLTDQAPDVREAKSSMRWGAGVALASAGMLITIEYLKVAPNWWTKNETVGVAVSLIAAIGVFSLGALKLWALATNTTLAWTLTRWAYMALGILNSGMAILLTSFFIAFFVEHFALPAPTSEVFPWAFSLLLVATCAFSAMEFRRLRETCEIELALMLAAAPVGLLGLNVLSASMGAMVLLMVTEPAYGPWSPSLKSAFVIVAQVVMLAGVAAAYFWLRSKWRRGEWPEPDLSQALLAVFLGVAGLKGIFLLVGLLPRWFLT